VAPSRLAVVPPYRALRFARVIVPALARYRWLEARRPADTAAWERAHDRTALGFAALGEDLGGLYVKLCQVAGARADVFPPVFVRELGRFHDRVTPRPFAALEPGLARELGRSPAEVFERIDPAPLAAASLAQVHRAWLRSGEPVVLKIQYPEAARLFATDLGNVRRALAVASRVFRGFALRGPIEEIARFVRLELDFAREAESLLRARDAFGNDADVRIPRLHAALCTPRLLVLEHLEGTPIVEAAAAADATTREALADRVARIYRRMLFDHGFFHGDPHPGNLLVLADGRLGLLDFGLAKALQPDFGRELVALFGSALRGDASGTVDAARRLGFGVDAVEPEAFLRVLAIALGARHDLAALRDALGASGIDVVPDDVALVIRTLVLLNGLSERLVPGERRIARALFAPGAASDPTPSAVSLPAAAVGPPGAPALGTVPPARPDRMERSHA